MPVLSSFSLPQDLKMVKDFWMNGVQVKIWKGKVEGECFERSNLAAVGCVACTVGMAVT